MHDEISKLIYSSKEKRLFNIEERTRLLIKLKTKILDSLESLNDAFILDLNKSKIDVYTSEVLLVIKEINYLIKKKSLFKMKRVRTNVINFPSKSYTLLEPFGVVLVISPWNYPLQLSLLPLVDAIMCGNMVCLKLSEYVPNINKVIKRIINEVFDKDIVTVFDFGVADTKKLLEEKFDFIFFTGSTNVGKQIMLKAAESLTPVCLELGGKSPCIINSLKNIDIYLDRIIYGKFLNAGQTCVAPDFIYILESLKDEFIKKLINRIKKTYYLDGNLTKDFTKIVNQHHFNRLISLIKNEKIIFGGNTFDLTIEPTVLDNVTFDSTIMLEEIFGPILPVITYKNLDEAILTLSTKPKSLALYMFTDKKEEYMRIINNLSFGGGCINDTLMHLTNPYLPFGGIGSSGIGKYHHKYSIETFSHKKAILIKNKMEIRLKYKKTDKIYNLIKRIFK